MHCYIFVPTVIQISYIHLHVVWVVRVPQVTLQTELAGNRGLAETYRRLQGQYVDIKSKVMDMFDERNRLEAGIKDLKQLKGMVNGSLMDTCRDNENNFLFGLQ